VRIVEGASARIIHALAALEEAGRTFGVGAWSETGRRGLRRCLATEAQPPPAMTACQLLAALSAFDDSKSAAALATRVAAMLQPDGRITDHPEGRGVASEHDFLPGVALLSLAKYAKRSGDGHALELVGPQFEWYRRRFRLRHPWGMVGWHTQAWTALHEFTRSDEHAAFVFEMADWALDRQHVRTGAFLSDLSPEGPSFHTAFLAEGIAAAWLLAIRVRDAGRADKYARSCNRALRFMDELIILPEDTYCMPDPVRARGGVRGTLTSSGVRIDYVSHTLMAYLNAIAAARAAGQLR
jgi:hypothetical protein